MFHVSRLMDTVNERGNQGFKTWCEGGKCCDFQSGSRGFDSEPYLRSDLSTNSCYCWWKKSKKPPNKSQHVWNPVNNRINNQPQLVSLPDFWTINSSIPDFVLQKSSNNHHSLSGLSPKHARKGECLFGNLPSPCPKHTGGLEVWANLPRNM